MEWARTSDATVISLTLEIDPSVKKSDALFERCSSWVLSIEDARAFFANAERITVEQKHQAYDSLPCRYQGVMSHRGRVYEFSINAGSHGYIKETGGAAGKDVSYFGCIEKCAKLFPFDMY